ncbi:hypothetical protein Tsedi_00622 [Tepidimonas sediminis]|uniref:Uncharacterized protein n=1 Tax=Tepidimonas sediminis TaxID=2588941 RepID=A0A554WTK2_9BURK|nr:hypothetical protein [Tepidimonas sediminis]TSE26912.1 hypothetical protein Tsedi_00622 [Tepidimonas sediminis]
MAAERLPPSVLGAARRLEALGLGDPRMAAEAAPDVLALLDHDRAGLLELVLPTITMTGWQTELLRCVAALARGQEPPEPLQWLPNWPHNRA